MSGVEQQAHLGRVVHRPEEGGRAAVIAPVRVAAELEQRLQQPGVAVERGFHERRRAGCAARVDERGPRSQQVDGAAAPPCVVARRAYPGGKLQGQRVGRRQVRFVGELVGPVCAGVDPTAHRVYFLVGQHFFRRHLLAELRIDQAAIEAARLAVARADDVADLALECAAASVETVAVALLVGPVALVAVLLEQRLDVTREIRPRGVRGGGGK